MAIETVRHCESLRGELHGKLHVPMDFVRRASSASMAGSWCAPEQIRKLFGFGRPFASRYCTTNRLSISMSQRIGSESGFEHIGDWLLGLESSYLR